MAPSNGYVPPEPEYWYNRREATRRLRDEMFWKTELDYQVIRRERYEKENRNTVRVGVAVTIFQAAITLMELYFLVSNLVDRDWFAVGALTFFFLICAWFTVRSMRSLGGHFQDTEATLARYAKDEREVRRILDKA